MEFITVRQAKDAGLMQLSTWVFDTDEQRAFLQRMYAQVMVNKGRTAQFVRSTSDAQIAIFVNRVAP